MLTITNIYKDEKLKYIKSKKNTLQTLLKLYPEENWDFEALSENLNLSWDIVSYYNVNRWNWSSLSLNNPHITCEIIERFIDFWDWNQLSRNSYIYWEMVEKFIDKPWNWSELSYNKSINIANTGFCNPTITRSPKLNIDFIKNNPNLPWDWKVFSQHPELTFDIVKMFIDKQWDWIELSTHKNLTNTIVKDNINFPWKWEFMNNKIDLFELQKHFPDLQITNHCNEQNSDMPLELIIQNINERRTVNSELFIHLSKNLFLYNDHTYERAIIKDNFINIILVLETIDTGKLSFRAENINCKSDICDYNVFRMIKSLLE